MVYYAYVYFLPTLEKCAATTPEPWKRLTKVTLHEAGFQVKCVTCDEFHPLQQSGVTGPREREMRAEPSRGSKSPVPIALICTASRRIPASASTNQGRFDPALRADAGWHPLQSSGVTGPRERAMRAEPSMGGKSSVPIALICTTNRERQYTSRTIRSGSEG